MSVSNGEKDTNQDFNHEVNGELEKEDVDPPLNGPESPEPNSDEREVEKVNGVTSSTEDPEPQSDEKEAEEIIAATNGSENPEQNGDDKEVEKIIGVTNDPGELQFAIKFKGIEEYELVPAKIANVMYPEHVIGYYEARLLWETAPNTYEKVKLYSKDESTSTDESA